LSKRAFISSFEAAGRSIDRAVVRKQLGDHSHRRLDQDQAGRFERLEEAGGQADGDAVADPLAFAIARLERDQSGCDLEVPGPDIVAQHRLGTIVAHVIARIDAADAARAGEADVPGPAGFVRRRDRVAFERRVGPVVGNLAGDRAVGEQRLARRLEGTAERAADQLGAEARAIDIEVGLEPPVLPGDEMGDRPGFVELDTGQQVADMANAELARALTENLGQAPGVEMIGIVERPGEVAFVRSLGAALRFGHPVLEGHRLGEGRAASPRPGAASRTRGSRPRCRRALRTGGRNGCAGLRRACAPSRRSGCPA
jgi:hypothetical protein